MKRRTPLFFFTVLAIPEFIILFYSSASLAVFAIVIFISSVFDFIVDNVEYFQLPEILKFIRLNYTSILRWFLERLLYKLQIFRNKSSSRQERRESFIDLFSFVIFFVMGVCILFVSPEYIVGPIICILFFILFYQLIKIFNFFFKEVLDRLRLLIINLSSRPQKFYDLLDEEHHRKSSNLVRIIQWLLPGVAKRISMSDKSLGIYRVIFNFYKIRRALLYWCVCLLLSTWALSTTAHVYIVWSIMLLLVLDIIFIK